MQIYNKFTPFLNKNKAEKFEEWTVKVSKQDPDAPGNIDIIDKSKLTTFKDYKNELVSFSDDYIKILDKDKDGKISYDEFEKHNIQQAKDNVAHISEEQLEQYKQTLKTIFEKLNADNEADSKDNLDIREVMNYFFMMDSCNDDIQFNGNISQYEYETCSMLLADNTIIGDKFNECLKFFFENFFKK